MLTTLALIASLAPAQTRTWMEARGPATLDGAGTVALQGVAAGLGATVVQRQNLTYVSFGSGIDPQPVPHRVFRATNVRIARCLSDSQYDTLSAARRLGVDLGIVGDGTKPPPAWFVTTGCSAGELVAEVSFDDKLLDAADVLALKALVVEIIRIAALTDTSADRLRDMTCGRRLDQSGQPLACSVAVVVDKSIAQHKAAIRAGSPPEKIPPGDAMLVN
jgi:hypothetical protein